jgi:hypothetical protein
VRREDGEAAGAIADALASWPAILDGYMRHRANIGRPIAWYEEPGIQRGAFATFIGLEFRDGGGPDHGGAFTVGAVGDACLFQIRGGRLRLAFR